MDEMFPSKSPLYKRTLSSAFKSQAKCLLDNRIYYDKIRSEILKFRVYIADISGFLCTWQRIADQAIKDVVYCYAYMDYIPRNKRFEPILQKSKFINMKTFSLIEFIRTKYSNNEFDLIEGLPLIRDFMTNFGVKFEDVPGGEYCHVLDI